MCDKCVELDRKIAHIRTLASRLIDDQTLRGVAEIVAEYEADKRALHPEQPKEP